jgi:hypothetical protein
MSFKSTAGSIVLAIPIRMSLLLCLPAVAISDSAISLSKPVEIRSCPPPSIPVLGRVSGNRELSSLIYLLAFC